MKQIRRHFTYANVMSSIAVFMILGGATAVAATKIGANEIKANSIKTGKIVKEAVTAGKIKKNAIVTAKIANGAVTGEKLADGSVTTAKIANDAVTGEKVNESTLGQVPSAASAGSVGGITVKKFFYKSNTNATVETILSLNGLILQASCPAGNIAGNATTSVNDAMIHSGGTSLGGVGTFYIEDDSFDIGNNFDYLEDAVTEGDSVQGTLTYTQPNGTVVTAVFESEEDSLGANCVISGHATS